jgi:hypothetical protein
MAFGLAVRAVYTVLPFSGFADAAKMLVEVSSVAEILTA